MADGITSLATLNYGTSTGGAAGAGETTTTLGVARQDERTPPDTSRVWAAQLNQILSLLLLMTADSKGGTRLLVREQSSNPFGVNESGFYIDANGVPYSVINGTRTALPFGQIVTATFTASDTTTVSWSNNGGTQHIFQGAIIVTDGSGPVVVNVKSVTTTGCTVFASGAFTGSVDFTIITV